MKKIIIGTIRIVLTPFLVLVGYYLLQYFNLPSGTLFIVSMFGFIGILFNFILGLALIIKGYQDKGTFNGW